MSPGLRQLIQQDSISIFLVSFAPEEKMSNPFTHSCYLEGRALDPDDWLMGLSERPSDGDGCVQDDSSVLHASYPLGGCLDSSVGHPLGASVDPLGYGSALSLFEATPNSNGETPWESNQDLDECASVSFGVVAKTLNYTPQEAYRILKETALRRAPPPPVQPCGSQQRFRWTNEFNEVVFCAYKYLGPENARPAPILTLIREALPDLPVTRQQVESRLQKVRISLRRAYGLPPTGTLSNCHIPKDINGKRYENLKGLWDRNKARRASLGSSTH
ncbi:GARP-like protein 4 [Giardia lamblia P15]|uniref:GARP-like protein 4 n=1 Tax=Giardia intestinalis (strain P15) TaxID=658858 RepID=E1F8U9_GIAIA|nr:GARP-like protein 4 [Giardia lamblia P15]